MKLIDLRSDTITKPTPEMRRAMAEAPVGDDVFAEDPTVNELQEKCAKLLGKEAALFVASGTMGNLISLLCHCPRGSEVILGDEAHIFFYEQGGASALGGLVYHTVPTQKNGQLALDAIEHAIRDKENVHFAAPGVICLENTHNRMGGVPLPVEYCWQVRQIADRAGIPLHLDGARLANAAVYFKKSIAEMAAPFHSVQFDLSKGLGAPVGGVVAGSAEFVKKARRARKILGGGWRQAGIIAAAGIVAIEKMVDRMADDHTNARLLAQGLSKLSQIQVDPESVQTNIIVFHLREPWDSTKLKELLKKEGILMNAYPEGRVRLVTNYEVDRSDVERVIETIGRIMKNN